MKWKRNTIDYTPPDSTNSHKANWLNQTKGMPHKSPLTKYCVVDTRRASNSMRWKKTEQQQQQKQSFFIVLGKMGFNANTIKPKHSVERRPSTMYFISVVQSIDAKDEEWEKEKKKARNIWCRKMVSLYEADTAFFFFIRHRHESGQIYDQTTYQTEIQNSVRSAMSFFFLALRSPWRNREIGCKPYVC